MSAGLDSGTGRAREAVTIIVRCVFLLISIPLYKNVPHFLYLYSFRRITSYFYSANLLFVIPLGKSNTSLQYNMEGCVVSQYVVVCDSIYIYIYIHIIMIIIITISSSSSSIW